VGRRCEGEADSGGEELQAGVDLQAESRLRWRGALGGWSDGGLGRSTVDTNRRRCRGGMGRCGGMAGQVLPQAMLGEGDRLRGRFGKKMFARGRGAACQVRRGAARRGSGEGRCDEVAERGGAARAAQIERGRGKM
jgi:hypothetical protein